MKKYIDAAKLYEHLEQVSGFYPSYADNIVDNAVSNVIDGIKTFIDSLQQEQQEVDLEKEIEEHAGNMPHCEFSHYTDDIEDEEWAKREFRYFYELGLKARK